MSWQKLNLKFKWHNIQCQNLKIAQLTLINPYKNEMGSGSIEESIIEASVNKKLGIDVSYERFCRLEPDKPLELERRW